MKRPKLPIWVYLVIIYMMPSVYSAAWFVKDFFSESGSFDGWSESIVAIGIPGAILLGLLCMFIVVGFIIFLLEKEI